MNVFICNNYGCILIFLNMRRVCSTSDIVYWPNWLVFYYNANFVEKTRFDNEVDDKFLQHPAVTPCGKQSISHTIIKWYHNAPDLVETSISLLYRM